MELAQSTLLVAALVGATSAVKAAFGNAVEGYITILVTVILGLIAGFSGVNGLTPLTGILYAFAATGVVTGVDRLRK